jgi:hypothetical protein
MACSTVLNLVADRVSKGRVYPALSTHEARPYTQAWREFGQHWPWTTPLRIQEYCQQHGVPIGIFDVDTVLPANTYYAICLGFFDFDIDYFYLLPPKILTLVKDSKVKILFMYHEGDNPLAIKNRLDALVYKNQLPADSYTFVSANSAADKLPGFVTFHDFELWYYQRNIEIPPLEIHNNTRPKDFTALVRLHKSWRAAVMADLCRNNILDNSFWSYCEVGELGNDNPIEIDTISQLRWVTQNFLDQGPYQSDSLPQDLRNNHSITESKYYTDAYCNIVLESQFDVDQSGGAFITEKTFKPIKHGQMFFIAGAAGSLQQLRDLGYKTFDSVLDNSYDLEKNHTIRWRKLKDAIASAKPQLKTLFNNARHDIEHNQQLFIAIKAQRLNTLIEKIHEQNR